MAWVRQMLEWRVAGELPGRLRREGGTFARWVPESAEDPSRCPGPTDR